MQNQIIDSRPIAVSFSAPSGSGKSTVIQKLTELVPQMQLSISDATRDPRGDEKHGVDYYFRSVEDFLIRRDNGNYLEFQEVYEGSYYGTSEAEFDRIRSAGKIVILDLDYLGAMNMKKLLGEQLLTFFLEVSLPIVETRLRDRGTETEEKIQQRLVRAQKELQAMPLFDCVIPNMRHDYGTWASRQAGRLIEEKLGVIQNRT